MVTTRADVKGPSKHGPLFWRKGAFALLIALLALGFVGVSTARSSAPLRPAVSSGQAADSAPAMVAFNGMLYVGWTGRNGAHSLNLMTYDPASQTFVSAYVLTDTTLVGSGPSLATFNGNLYVAWRGTDNGLNIGRYNPANPTVLANKVTLSERSNNAPSIAALGGRLYLTWRGTDGSLNIISSANASTFGSKVTYGIAVRTSPSLIVTNGSLFVVWEDVSASSHIVVAGYDPSQPAILKNVVTLASTSQLPVGLASAGVAAPYFRVAWRTGSDAHIRLAIFEGSQFLHNPVYTAETTPYGPALALFAGVPYMCWTGTDGAQSVNVSQANI